jgi:predicted transcriptional regulator
MGVDLMNDYNCLLFELSSVDRLDILELLRKSPLKLSHISRKLNFTVQETSRNVNRLQKSGLIAKNVDGTFSLTTYGEATFGLLSGFSFLYKNRNYFATHSTSQLPEPFRRSLGVLDDFELVDDVMIVFHNIENMIKHAKDFVWIMSDQILASTLPDLVAGLQRGMKFRLLMPKTYLPSGDVRSLVSNSAFEQASKRKIMETRYSDAFHVFLCISENEVSDLAFLTSEGKFDYRGFKTEKSFAIEWAKMLFTHYWNNASSQIPEQIAQ